MVTWEQKAKQVLKESLEVLDLSEQPVLMVKLDLQVKLVLLERLELLVKLDLMDKQELTEWLVQLEASERLVTPEPKEKPDLRERSVQPA